MLLGVFRTGVFGEFCEQQGGVGRLPGQPEHLHGLEGITLVQKLARVADQQGLDLREVVPLGEVYGPGCPATQEGRRYRKTQVTGRKQETRASLAGGVMRSSQGRELPSSWIDTTRAWVCGRVGVCLRLREETHAH